MVGLHQPGNNRYISMRPDGHLYGQLSAISARRVPQAEALKLKWLLHREFKTQSP